MVFVIIILVFIHQSIDDDNEILCIFPAEVKDLSSDRSRKLIWLA